MKNITIKQLKQVNTYEDLEALNIGNIYCDISYRGGGIGYYADDISNLLNIPAEYLPEKFGAGCNYLGGGLRGVIFASTFNHNITGVKAKLLEAIASACVRVYNNIEIEAGFQDETDEDDNINWENTGTILVRKQGIEPAY